MKQFSGFPARTQFTPIPNAFFSSLLPEIEGIAELKVTLHLFRLLYRKRGYPRFVAYRELISDAGLMNSLRGEEPTEEALGKALDLAVKRGTVLRLAVQRDGAPEDVYFLNTESDRQVVTKIKNGELALTGLKAGGQAYQTAKAEPLPDLFTLYEENIGMLTPMIAEELKEAKKLYPEDWIRDAIKEAVSQNKRRWSYISAILERWAAEGRSDGAYRRDSKKDQDKYLKQKYGHMVRR